MPSSTRCRYSVLKIINFKPLCELRQVHRVAATRKLHTWHFSSLNFVHREKQTETNQSGAKIKQNMNERAKKILQKKTSARVRKESIASNDDLLVCSSFFYFIVQAHKTFHRILIISKDFQTFHEIQFKEFPLPEISSKRERVSRRTRSCRVARIANHWDITFHYTRLRELGSWVTRNINLLSYLSVIEITFLQIKSLYKSL